MNQIFTNSQHTKFLVSVQYAKMMRWWFNWLFLPFSPSLGIFKSSVFGIQDYSIYPLVLEKKFENLAAFKANVVKIIISLKDVRILRGNIYKENLFSLWNLQILFVYFSLPTCLTLVPSHVARREIQLSFHGWIHHPVAGEVHFIKVG